MRLMLVVQRYGEEIAGGSEQCCRLYAEHLVERGHHVEVATSCALNYTDWENHFPAGESMVNGVTVHRFEVDSPRQPSVFQWFNRVNISNRQPVPLRLQEMWIDCMGPRTVDLPAYLESRVGDIDLFIFFTYLYYPTVRGLQLIAGRAPTVFLPTAHAEPMLNVGVQDRLFRFPDVFGFLTPEERNVVRSAFGIEPIGEVIGVGVNLEVAGDPARFRSAFGLGDNRYLVYVGRVDPGKGSVEAVEFFRAYKERNPGDLRLVIVGDPVHVIDYPADVVSTGFVDEQTKNDAIAGAIAYLQPSYFESFSMSLTECWALSRPALVQGKCEVLVGQAVRARGAIPYDGYVEFECAVNVLLENPALGDALGACGRKYVEEQYDWNVVMDRTETLMSLAIERFSSRVGNHRDHGDVLVTDDEPL